jgi:hypothetical protein
MKFTIICVLIQALCTVCFSENLRFKQFGTPIPARADLDVEWNAGSNAFPPKAWVYHLRPTKFSSNTIPTLLKIGSFTNKDRTDRSTNEIRFKSLDSSRRLFVSFTDGVIDYEVTTHYGPTNLARDVPDRSEVLDLTKELLPQLGVNLSDIDKEGHNSEPRLGVSQPLTEYYVNHTFITNTEWRRANFRRTVDGIAFLSAGTGGDGEVRFGEHGKIIKIYLSWRNMEREKSYVTVRPETIMKSIRKGQAVQGYLPDDSPGIDWPTVKSVTIKNAWPCYYAGNPLAPSDWLYPFAALSTTVDTGHGNVDVEIDCPIIEETGE